MQTGQFVSAPDAVRLIVSKEGFRGLYAVWDLHVPFLFHYSNACTLSLLVWDWNNFVNLGPYFVGCFCGFLFLTCRHAVLHFIAYFGYLNWMTSLKLQGYSSFLLRDLPFDAIQFCIYEQLRLGYKAAVSSLPFIVSCLQKYIALNEYRHRHMIIHSQVLIKNQRTGLRCITIYNKCNWQLKEKTWTIRWKEHNLCIET